MEREAVFTCLGNLWLISFGVMTGVQSPGSEGRREKLTKTDRDGKI